MGVVKYFEIVDNVFSIIFITFDDLEADRKLIGANKLARKTIGFQLRELTDIFFLETLVIHYQYKEHSFF